MTEGRVTVRPKTTERIQDCTQGAWHLELSYGHCSGDNVQVASVNLDSKFVFPPDSEIDEPEPFDGWRVTLNKQGLADLIERAQAIHDRMPD